MVTAKYKRGKEPVIDEAGKRRLVGAAVLVALAVIFVPMLLEDEEQDGLGEPIEIPGAPDFDRAYDQSAVGAADGLNTQLPSPELPSVPVPDDETPEAFPEWSEAESGPLPVPEPPASAARSAETAPAPAIPETRTVPAVPEPRRTPAAPEPRTAPSATPKPALAAAGPKPVPAGTSAWVVQVASLGSSEAARKLQDELRGKGYSAFVEQAVVGGKQYYRVRVGPEIDRAKADRVASKLEGETGSKPLVQTYR
jgi:DedD protein